MPYRKEVLEFIGSFPAECGYADQVRRKKTLMNLKGGEPYRYIIREFCPCFAKRFVRLTLTSEISASNRLKRYSKAVRKTLA